MIVIYDKAKFANFWQAFHAGDYVLSHRMSFAHLVATNRGYINPQCLTNLEV